MSGRESDNNLGVVFPSPEYVLDAFLELAEVKESDVVYDLGCNDGRLLIAAAERQRARCVGVERDVKAYRKAKEAVENAGLDRLVDIKLGDAMDVDLGNATVVYLYLSPAGLEQLKGKLKNELKPNARVISYMFRIPGWDDQLVEVKGASSQQPNRMDVSNISKLYRYTVPKRLMSGRHRRSWWRVALCTLVTVAMARFAVKFKGICCGAKHPKLSPII
ncbi:hypothetical protein BSKO_01100 [Bryopsis sp. KO-2023]|nr:hypothetical protein BSKO_01100 [Bryopsis sp. KO-2023]